MKNKFGWLGGIDGWEEMGGRTDITVYEPAIRRSADRTPYTNQTMLFRARQQRSRRRVRLSPHTHI